MKRLLIAPILLLVASLGVVPQNPTQTPLSFKQIIGGIDPTPPTTEELLRLRVSDHESFIKRDLDYLLARRAEADGDLALAMELFHSVAERDPALRCYALRHLSQIARSTGNQMLERLYLRELLVSSSEGLLAPSARLRLAEAALEGENYAETIRILTTTRNSGKPDVGGTTSRDIEAMLGRAYLRSGRIAQARNIFTILLDGMPNASQPDDAAVVAAKGLDLMDGGTDIFGLKAPAISVAEHLRRASIYQFNRDFEDARLHFEAIVAGDQKGPAAADAIYQMGRGFIQEGNLVRGISSFERILEQFPESNAAVDALLQAASAYGRIGKTREGIVRYQQFIDKYPSDEKIERAYLNIIDLYRDEGQDTDALKWCVKTREVFRGKTPEAVALFSEARVYLARENWPSSLEALDRLEQFSDLGGATVAGGTNAAEVAFLRAYVLERLRRYPEAIDGYLAISDGRGEYYGWQSTQRLRGLSSDDAASSFITQKVGVLSNGLTAPDLEARRKNAMALVRITQVDAIRQKALAVLGPAIAASPRYQDVPEFNSDEVRTEKKNHSRERDAGKQTIGDRLLALGLYDEAAPEIEAAMARKTNNTPTDQFALATYYKRGDRGDKAVSFIESQWRKLPADFPIELMPRYQAELLYPVPYAASLRGATAERGVDPRLVLAVMRQESRFKPDAKSYAAARGLMQFIATTAKLVAGELGRENFRQDDLYHPPTAILFGSQYMSDLFKLFPGQEEAVAASYNGGEDNVKRWIARSRATLPEKYVPEIAYIQTKDYVYKVMANYRMYQHLYDADLHPR